jgi:hypothetical protein
MGIIKNHSAVCPECKSKVKTYISPCSEHECCSINHEITCINKQCKMTFLIITTDYYVLRKEFLRLNEKKEELYY